MANLLTKLDMNSVVIYPGMETKIKYGGLVRDCRIEQIEMGKGYIRVFDHTRNDYRTFQIGKIGQ